MPAFERALHVQAPRESLFWLSQDYGRRRLRWVLGPLMLGWFAWESWRRLRAFKRFAESSLARAP